MKRKMATKQATLVHVDEDYIDMELCSSPPNNFFSYSINSPTFEFQMNSKDSSTSPADDLFYKGKLLPLHLPPRLQMVQNLLENSNNANFVKSNSTFQDTNFIDLRTPSTNTILESFNISPSESCRVSSDLSSNEYKFEWSSSSSSTTTTTTCTGDLPKKSWPKKLKQMKQLLLGQRLKASRSYLKTLFNKSGCSDKFCASATNNTKGAEKKSKCKECQNKYIKVAKRNNPFGISCAVFDREMLLEDDFSNHRRSFSGVGQRNCAIKSSSFSTSSSGSSSSSSSFSFSSAGYYDLQLFKRSISANYELEGSIEGAIAHCKQSQQQCCSKNDSDGSRICSQFETKMQLVEVKK